jgi:hypothetical protein
VRAKAAVNKAAVHCGCNTASETRSSTGSERQADEPLERCSCRRTLGVSDVVEVR